MHDLQPWLVCVPTEVFRVDRVCMYVLTHMKEGSTYNPIHSRMHLFVKEKARSSKLFSSHL